PVWWGITEARFHAPDTAENRRAIADSAQAFNDALIAPDPVVAGHGVFLRGSSDGTGPDANIVVTSANFGGATSVGPPAITADPQLQPLAYNGGPTMRWRWCRRARRSTSPRAAAWRPTSAAMCATRRPRRVRAHRAAAGCDI